MQMDELIVKINQNVEEYDYTSARIYIEENLDLLKENKRHLNSNAREILNFLIEQADAGVKPLSRNELSLINAINTYAYKFDLRGIKMLLKDNTKLFLREETIAYLNSDANTILTGMGVIKK